MGWESKQISESLTDLMEEMHYPSPKPHRTKENASENVLSYLGIASI